MVSRCRRQCGRRGQSSGSSPIGIWATARHEHVQAILNDHSTFCRLAGRPERLSQGKAVATAKPAAGSRSTRSRPAARASSRGSCRRSRYAICANRLERGHDLLAEPLVEQGTFRSAQRVGRSVPVNVLSGGCGRHSKRGARKHHPLTRPFGFATFRARAIGSRDEVMAGFPQAGPPG